MQKVNLSPLFFGHCAEFVEFGKSKRENILVYILRCQRGPFYVGVGSVARVMSHMTRSAKPAIREMVDALGDRLTIEVDGVFRSDQRHLALQRERELVTAFGRVSEGGPLLNETAGGSGWPNPSPISRGKRAATLRRRPADPEARRFFDAAAIESSPLKEAGRFKVRETRPHPRRQMWPTPRMLVIAEMARWTGVELRPGAVIPRQVNGLVLENGCSADLVTARVAKVIPAADPSEEQFEILPDRFARVLALLKKFR